MQRLSRSLSRFETQDIKMKRTRFGYEERRLMHLVPAPAVRLKKRQVLSRPGINSQQVINLLVLETLFSSSIHLVTVIRCLQRWCVDEDKSCRGERDWWQRLTFPFPFVHHQSWTHQREGREHLWNLNLGSARQSLLREDPVEKEIWVLISYTNNNIIMNS